MLCSTTVKQIEVFEAHADGKRPPLTGGPPQVSEASRTDLAITWPVDGGGEVRIWCGEDTLALDLAAGEGPRKWALTLTWAAEKRPPIERVEAERLVHKHGFRYQVRCAAGHFARSSDENAVLIWPDGDGIVLDLNARR